MSGRFAGLSGRFITRLFYFLISLTSLLWLLRIILQFLLLDPPSHHVEVVTRRRLVMYDDDEEEVVTKPSRTVYTEPELTRVVDLNIPTQTYSFHPACNCSRTGASILALEQRFLGHSAWWGNHWMKKPLDVPDGVYMGKSSCNDQVSALGGGQRILTYSYYSPWRHVKVQYLPNGKPRDTDSRFQELLQPLADSMSQFYPGWRMRIYHNVTLNDTTAWPKLCQLYCDNSHVDLCDVRNLPTLGNLNDKFPIGRFWRFQVLGDPTVRMFGSRDVDSFLFPREVDAVKAWRSSNKQFHVMRDGPHHRSTVLAGLWGADNYMDKDMTNKIRDKLLNVAPSLYKFFDQQVLDRRVWPFIRDHSMIHDSYNCGMVWKFGHCKPWPTQRKGYKYVGYGPTKGYAVRNIVRKKCPVKCRPKEHLDWEYC